MPGAVAVAKLWRGRGQLAIIRELSRALGNASSPHSGLIQSDLSGNTAASPTQTVKLNCLTVKLNCFFICMCTLLSALAYCDSLQFLFFFSMLRSLIGELLKITTGADRYHRCSTPGTREKPR